ncbi:spore maturation protein [Anaerovoracaceae bacterium 41-7]|jgi:spore maturation protein B|uniref:Spore maturation protein n=1 Tax=Anaerotruncus colihominis TaxID=169435 RepID=A0A845QGT6_9FIRM|nr:MULTISPECIES: spore maturation protein [Clostridia]MCI9476858.1 spore maturation protein [Emergencia sp.]MCI9640936.1 spore maturation protein [Emergencia sp.]NBH61280.1 spore maturation protein [Anaerotruncus colihominis]NCE98645.1 spore maturation protein [Emergencia sp. 1XD21-10]NCF01935.1 spore maturation protein [Anaerotruncus sp. 80]
MTAVLEAISIWAIPVVVALVAFYAICKKVPVYSVFTEGAKEGFSTAIMIIPYLVAMLCAIGMFRASGAMDFICDLLAPVTNVIGLPSEVLPMAIMRSFSGGGAEGMMADLLAQYGTQSQIGRIASVALGSTETTFYVVAVYFGSVGISNTRHSIAAGLLGDLASLIAATLIVNIMWF